MTEDEVKAKDNLTRVIVFRVTEDVGRRLDDLAEDLDRKVSWVCRRAIDEWLAEQDTLEMESERSE